MKRLFLICMIVGLCALVAICGNFALVDGSGGLLTDRKSDCQIMVDVGARRLFLLRNEEIVKSYPAIAGNDEKPAPLGSWNAVLHKEKLKDREEVWLALNVPWGSYSIHDTECQRSFDMGSVRMFHSDMAELISLADSKTTVFIYDSEVTYRQLEPGSKGADVYNVEKRLRTLGYFVGKVDGIYDSDLQEAAEKFQKEHGLKKSKVLDVPFMRSIGIVVMD